MRFDRHLVPRLLRRYPTRLVWSAYLLVNGFLTIGLLTTVALLSGTPFVFPSLGPTAILLFVSPTQPAACPRNTLAGHTIGILCGYASLWLLGLTGDSSAMTEGMQLQRVLSAALSLGVTGALMTLLDLPHTPAGATTLIVALGIITHPYHLLIIVISIVVLLGQALVINRLVGIDYPVWAPRTKPTADVPIPSSDPSPNRNSHGPK